MPLRVIGVPAGNTARAVQIDRDFINADEFLIADLPMPDGHRHLVFATEYQLSLLRQARRWYIDGTFKIVGAPFRRHGQLFSINAFVERNGQSKQVPLVYSLMSRRTCEDYFAVFRATVDALGQHVLQGVMADFEIAAWQAVRTVFPGADLKGCAFHWSQAVWRAIQRVGLQETYTQRTEMRRFLRLVLGLPFLPAGHIVRAFQHIEASASTPETREIMEYVRRQWIDSTVFRVEEWSAYQQTVRTNNDVEGWHARINRKAGGSLSFYRLVPFLRRESDLVRLAMETGDLERTTSRQGKLPNEKVTKLTAQYIDAQLRTDDFLVVVAALYTVVQ